MSLEDRLNFVKTGYDRASRNITKKIDIRRRNKTLLDIEGYYTTEGNSISKIDWLDNIHHFYKISGSPLKFSRWVDRNWDSGVLQYDITGRRSSISSYINIKTSGLYKFDKEWLPITKERVLSLIGKKMNDKITFKISCRHNDLLRLHDTPHYFSCYCGWRKGQMARYLADPDVGVIFVPDKSGKFLWRCLCRLVTDSDNTMCLALYKDYGNSDKSRIISFINKNIMPVYLLGSSGHRLYSATPCNNKAVSGRDLWSDHPKRFDKETNRIYFVGNPIGYN